MHGMLLYTALLLTEKIAESEIIEAAKVGES